MPRELLGQAGASRALIETIEANEIREPLVRLRLHTASGAKSPTQDTRTLTRFQSGRVHMVSISRTSTRNAMPPPML